MGVFEPEKDPHWTRRDYPTTPMHMPESTLVPTRRWLLSMCDEIPGWDRRAYVDDLLSRGPRTAPGAWYQLASIAIVPGSRVDPIGVVAESSLASWEVRMVDIPVPYAPSAPFVRHIVGEDRFTAAVGHENAERRARFIQEANALGAEGWEPVGIVANAMCFKRAVRG